MEELITLLFGEFVEIRYVAVYKNEVLTMRQRDGVTDNSSADTDRYEELLVNPTILTIARQRGNIDCGGVEHVLIAYGNFVQLIKEIKGGHISICLNNETDVSKATAAIIQCIETWYAGLL